MVEMRPSKRCRIPIAMTWVRDIKLTWLQRLAVNVMRCGPIPGHVAFIMDGNRRYATKAGMASAADGHRHGFNKLAEALQWCLELGIAEATVYAFSIENFKRSDSEVSTLMGMAEEKFAQMLGELDQLDEQGICVRIVGNWSLLPPRLQSSMAKAVLRTAGNRRAVLNVAFAYTSRDEATEAIRSVAEAVRGAERETGADEEKEEEVFRAEDITDEVLRGCMHTRRSAEPELLVRTSGESRLSDFMLFQLSTTIVYFTDTLWPEFSIWHLLAGIFYYQTQHERMRSARHLMLQQQCSNANTSTASNSSARTAAFLRRFDERERGRLQALCLEA